MYAGIRSASVVSVIEVVKDTSAHFHPGDLVTTRRVPVCRLVTRKFGMRLSFSSLTTAAIFSIHSGLVN